MSWARTFSARSLTDTPVKNNFNQNLRRSFHSSFVSVEAAELGTRKSHENLFHEIRAQRTANQLIE